MIDLNDFWDSINPGHRHVPSYMSEEKKKRILDRFKKHLESYLKGKVWTMDWGCGGGLLTKEIAKTSNVIAVDVSWESLREIIRNSLEVQFIVYLPSDITTLQILVHVDAIHCSNVIHHFSSLSYFKNVVSLWKASEPDIIAINAKTGRLVEQFEKDYINALIIPEHDIVKEFEPEYKLLYIKTEALKSRRDLTHFVFERRQR